MDGELTIVGAGLIGASFALAVRERFERITLLDPDDAHATYALEHGMADARVERVPGTAGAILIACPSHRIAGIVESLAGHPGTVFDAGSVKGAIIREVTAALGSTPANFVPAHPIAGREKSGPQAASADLFRGKSVILTPTGDEDVERVRQVEGWWAAAGAAVSRMDADAHDAVYARTSHLPHLIAFAYLLGIGPEDLEHTGGGFRDFSRIGASDPDMWSAIFERNRGPLASALDSFEAHLAEFRRALVRGDVDAMHRLIARARKARADLP